MVGITGGSGSGKTYFLHKLIDSFASSEICLISQDNYYRPRQEQKIDDNGIHNFDLPEAIDYLQFIKDIESLHNGETIYRTEYTFNNPNKVPKTLEFLPLPIIVVEGLFALYFPDIVAHLDLKIFVEAQSHMKIKRRILRDNIERGYDLHDVLYRYEHHVMPTYKKFIEPSKDEADFVVPNNKGGMETALDVLTTFLKSKIAQNQEINNITY
jgi:uridine kinase